MFDANAKATIISTFSEEKRVDTKIITAKELNQVEGVIMNECGCVMQKACIKVLTSDYEPLTHTMSNSKGEFVLIYSYDEEVILIISKEGYKTVVLENFCREIEVTLTKLTNSAVLTGRLVLKNGGEINSARVRLVNNMVKKQVFPDCDGFFVITEISSGCYQLIIDGNEYIKTVLTINICNSTRTYNLGSLIINKVNIMGTIHGIVSDGEDIPIDNAVVLLYNLDMCFVVAKTITNKEGLYFFGNVDVGNYHIMAYH